MKKSVMPFMLSNWADPQENPSVEGFYQVMVEDSYPMMMYFCDGAWFYIDSFGTLLRPAISQNLMWRGTPTCSPLA